MPGLPGWDLLTSPGHGRRLGNRPRRPDLFDSRRLLVALTRTSHLKEAEHPPGPPGSWYGRDRREACRHGGGAALPRISDTSRRVALYRVRAKIRACLDPYLMLERT
jgi:hypothetical protein